MAMRDRAGVVGSAEFKARCLELVEHVRESRAEYVVTRHGVPVARLVPVEASGETTRLLGSMGGSILQYDGPFEPVPGDWRLDGGPPARRT